MSKERIFILARTLRVNQWVKNLVVFTAILMSGVLFEGDLFLKTFYAFVVFCMLSSASYVLNDIIDYPLDRKHPIKKNRPIPAGKVTIPEATFIVFILTLVSLVASLFLSPTFFFLSLVFILLHFFYSLYLKNFPIIDIFTISFSFMIRAFGGEVVSGFHIPIWLLLTIFFVSLFMATVKRHAELVSQGSETRLSLMYYKEHLLDFLTNTFAAITIIAYAFYTYFERLPTTKTVFTEFFSHLFPDFEARKLMMITVPLVVYGISRYAQLLYEYSQGERPEKIITTDKPLIVTVLLWGVITVSLIYIF